MSSSPFQKVDNQVSFPAIEEAVLKLWQETDAFQESNRRRQRHGKGDFVFYDGPPFATGTPHYGHLLAGTIKDIVPRFWNMRGYHVERRFGWDCHGLPIEALAQEALGLAGSGAIKEHGVDAFNEQCRSMVQTYVDEWRKTVTRMGRWVDFDNDYKTMDTDFMESVWWVFKQLWDKGRIYKAHRIMPYSWKLTTPLSNFEANSNYKDVQDPAITIRFALQNSDHGLGADKQVYALAWTTTPWTLPANLALCVGPELDYVFVRDKSSDDIYVLAQARLETYYKNTDDYELLKTVAGSELKGWTYEPLFPYFADRANCFQILQDEFVSTDSGTGIVHMAPAYGEDDYRICSDADIALIDPLNEEAEFTELVPEYKGQFCKDADKAIIKRLKDADKLIHQSTISHSYPFCERTDTPLIYRAIDAWYVKVEDINDRLMANNNTVNWVPEHVGSGRFGNWLKDAKDWNISRNRFWGSCIPVWVNTQDKNDCVCVGSIKELEEFSGVTVDDLHKHIVDDIVVQRDGKTYRRTPEVLDCWFESGSMPYAQQHFPFEGNDDPSDFLPADFIAEGLDQTRGWFYTLLVLSTLLYDKPTYKNVIVNGLILAEDGEKMSKRKQNYPDPNKILSEIGADALRAYMINSPVVRGEPLKFSESGLKDIVRSVVIPYWSTLSFFTTYADVDGYDPRSWEAPPVSERPDLDRWVLSVLQSLVRDIDIEMNGYRLYNVVPRLVSFIDDLTNWYVRSSRRRFWKSEDDTDKRAAFSTLYEVLVTFAKLLAPFMPFITEEIYQRLVRSVDEDAPRSVHWCDYPEVDAALIDKTLEQRMDIIRRSSSLGRKLREDHKLKVRQPLAGLTIVHRDEHIRQAVTDGAGRIMEELNVKNVHYESDESNFTTVTVKPNFQELKKRCPQKLGAIGKTLKGWSFAEVGKLEDGEAIDCAGEALGIDDVILQRQAKEGAAVATDGELTVVLDTALTPALEREGLARELTSAVQKERRNNQLEVSDRIKLFWHSSDEELAAAIDEHADYIGNEVLAAEISKSDNDAAVDLDINGRSLRVLIQKA